MVGLIQRRRPGRHEKPRTPLPASEVPGEVPEEYRGLGAYLEKRARGDFMTPEAIEYGEALRRGHRRWLQGHAD